MSGMFPLLPHRLLDLPGGRSWASVGLRDALMGAGDPFPHREPLSACSEGQCSGIPGQSDLSWGVRGWDGRRC